MPSPANGAASRFLHAHATHPNPLMALALVAAQLDGQRSQLPGFQPTLGLLYLSGASNAVLPDLLDQARSRWPGLALTGCTGLGVGAAGVEYFDEPALVVLLCELPPTCFRLFGGRHPLDWDAAWTALVHADGTTHDLPGLLQELAERTGSGQLFGGVASGRRQAAQWSDGALQGGLCGVAFNRQARVLSRLTQGCRPEGPTRQITAAEHNLVLRLDDQPALPLLLADVGLTLNPPGPALHRLRHTLAGLSDAHTAAQHHPGQLGAHTRVRHVVGIDPSRQAVALADRVEPGMRLTFARRDPDTARRDLIRVCAELREEVETTDDGTDTGLRVAAAHYVSCTGRGAPYFGSPAAEWRVIAHALGEAVPVVGFFAAGEVAGRHLHGHSGVLTVWATPSAP